MSDVDTATKLIMIELKQGISCIDIQLQRPGLACCYLLVEEGQAAFIDCGTGNSLPLLLAALKRRGLTVNDVRYVIPTHVHLDHAGGAGVLMKACPEAKLVVHPRGARHLIDPTRLEQGALAVYGEQKFAQLFGKLEPIAESRVIEAADGFRLHIAQRPLLFLDTPGHARHHFCIYDEQSRGLFTGDSFGASYPELNHGRARFIFPPTTPVQFDPEAWHQTLDRLMALDAERVYLTHFGMHEDLQPLARQLRQSIADYADIAREFVTANERQQRIQASLMQYSLNYLLDQHCGIEPGQISGLLAMDMQLNAQGLEHWLSQSEAV